MLLNRSPHVGLIVRLPVRGDAERGQAGSPRPVVRKCLVSAEPSSLRILHTQRSVTKIYCLSVANGRRQ